MKFIIATQTFAPRSGGMQTVMIALAQKFSTIGETHVFPNHFIEKNNHIFKEKFKIHNFFAPKILRSYLKKIFISRIIEKDDIVICDSWKSVSAVPSKANKIIVLAHGQEYLSYKKKYPIIKQSLDRVNHIICSSNYTYNLIDNLNITHTNKVVLPPTYSLVKIAVNNETNNSKLSDKVQLLSITRLEERKGIIPVLNALAVLIKNKSLKPFIWNICGSGDLQNKIEKTIKELNLTNYVNLIGRVDNKDKEFFLNLSDLFIMPSYKVENSIEGFGISYVEAAGYGIPSIAGEEGGVKDAVLDNITGWCINPLDKVKLSKVLLEAINNDQKRNKFGLQAKKQFLDLFLGEKVFRKFMKTITS